MVIPHYNLNIDGIYMEIQENELWSFGESDCSDNRGFDRVQSPVAEVPLKMKQIW